MSYYNEDLELARALAATFISDAKDNAYSFESEQSDRDYITALELAESESEQKKREEQSDRDYAAALELAESEQKNREKQTSHDYAIALELVESEQKNREKQADHDYMLALELQYQQPPISNPKVNDLTVKYFANEVQFCCPHCFEIIFVSYKEFNCRIFRCGKYMSGNGESVQFPQHGSESVIKALMLQSKGNYRGCGNPFRIEGDVSARNVKVVKCLWTE